MTTLVRPLAENERNQEATVYIGNLDERVDEALLWELMLQVGPLISVHIPRDRITHIIQGYGFAEFLHEKDAEYASAIMNQIRLFGKPIRVNKATADKQRQIDVGADLYIGNLDPLVDEKLLYDTFSGFGSLISVPKIARDSDGNSRGFGFVSFDNFESSDSAIESMDNQYLMNKTINVSYAFKKDGKGERHGDEAERALAKAAKKNKHTIQPLFDPSVVFGTKNDNRNGVYQNDLSHNTIQDNKNSNMLPPVSPYPIQQQAHQLIPPMVPPQSLPSGYVPQGLIGSVLQGQGTPINMNSQPNPSLYPPVIPPQFAQPFNPNNFQNNGTIPIPPPPSSLNSNFIPKNLPPGYRPHMN